MNQSQFHCCLGIVTIFFFFCLLLVPNTTFASPTRFLCRNNQRDALLELKEEFLIHTDDDNYGTTISWNKSIDCCSWEGVKCDANLGEVISLRLVANRANTCLKSSSGLFKLQHLQSLELSSILLNGEIPSSFGNLSRLTYLDLSFNQLVGEVPASFGNLNQLRYMDLSRNDLRGNIPTSFANLTKLSVLNLMSNQFTGGDKFIANLTRLSEIDLSNNHFKSSISAYLSELHNLEKFSGSRNSFFGPFPSSLLMNPSLTYIGLDHNQFDGPVDLGNTSSSSQLDGLEIAYNNFSGIISKSISKLRSLYSLDLSHNNFRGQVPSSISKLVNLSSLDLSYNKFEGQVPHCLWRSSKLWTVQLSHNSFTSFNNSVEVIDGASVRELDLSSNSLQGPFPQWICKLRDLWALDFSNNLFTGSIPRCLTYLQELNLRNNSLSGFLPDLFTNSSDLRSLDVSRNNLVGKLPKSLIHCKSMEFLSVQGNKIKDMFPFWLGSLQNLKILMIGSNGFYGPVYNSSAYLGFPRMRIIDISNNNFTGSLPQDYFSKWREMSIVWSNEGVPESEYMGDNSHMYEDSIELMYKGVDTDFVRIFQAFKAIDFSRNRFYGDIPRSVGMLSELRLLNLSGNAFTGSIPSSLASITNLETLDLSRNNLSGKIPQDLGKLSSLSIINFSHNHLEGLVPKSTQFSTQKCSSFMGNPGLYGLEKICVEPHVPVPKSHQPEKSLLESEEPVVNWIAAAIAYGPGVFCGLVIGHIFTSYKHEWFISR